MEKTTKKAKDIRFEKEAKALRKNLNKRKKQEQDLKKLKSKRSLRNQYICKGTCHG